MDANRTQALSSVGGVAPTAFDPNRTVIGNVTAGELTATIAPRQCPVCRSFNPAGRIFCDECGLIFADAPEGDAFGAPVARLARLIASDGREHFLREGEAAVGREGDVAISDGRVSRRHARLIVSAAETSVEDLGSTNGTRINGVPLSSGEVVALTSGDIVSFGGVELRYEGREAEGSGENTTRSFAGNRTQAISAPPSAKPTARLVGGAYDLPLRMGPNTFGRRAGNDVVIPDPYVSGLHGTIEVGESEVWVTDDGSTNGTVVAGGRIPTGERIRLEPGEAITLGSLELRVER